MLQHEQEEQRGYVSPISNLRVTPSELAQAVAAIESRREGIEQDTIAIGDAIEQLGLRVSPQDVYSEIQRQQNVKREAATAAVVVPAVTAKRGFRFRNFLLSCVIVGSLMLNLLAILAFARSSSRSVEYSRPAYSVNTEYPAIEGSPVVEETIRTSDVTETRPGFANLYQLHELANGADPNEIMLRAKDAGLQSGDSQWEVYKLGGQYFVRGYTYPEGTFHLNDSWTKNDTSNVFSHFMDNKTVPRTVPLKDFTTILNPKWTTLDGKEGVQIPLQKKGD